MITKKQFNEKYGANIRKAEKGTGIAIVDTFSYAGCTVVGEYPCYPLKSWLECIDADEVEKYGFSIVMNRAQERLAVRVNGNHFGNPIYGQTGSYSVK
jgi:hypothetical protein